MRSIFFICVLCSKVVLAEETDELHGKIAVMALVKEKEPHHLMEVVKRIQRKLVTDRRVELLPAAQAIQLLGGPGFVGSESANLERLWGNYQQGYIQSYNFEYRQAIENLKRVIRGLEKVSDSPARWDLYELANLYLGISHIGRQDKQAAIRAFQLVLRTRSTMDLNKKNYPPKVRKIWSEARKALGRLPRGKLLVETDPRGARVMVDGVSFGSTPLEIDLPFGTYYLRMTDQVSGSVSRWVEVGEKPVQIRLKMHFEAAMVLHRDYPAIKLPKGHRNLPSQWWPWLGTRLGVKHIALVREQATGSSLNWSVSLVDLERSRVIREGWLESSGLKSKQLQADATDLANFLITGQPAKRVISSRLEPLAMGEDLVTLGKKTKDRTREVSKKPSPGKNAKKTPRGAKSAPTKDTVVSTGTERPFFRRFWPYAVAGGLFLASGIAGHYVSADFQKRADKSSVDPDTEGLQQRADTWKGISIVGFGTAVASVLAGVVLYYTYKPDRSESETALWVSGDLVGIVVWGRF